MNRFTISLVAVIVVASVGCGGTAPPPAKKVVKVGMILTYSGADASIGEAIDRAAELYLKLHRQDLPADIDLQIVKRDETGPSPDIARRLAQELLVRDGVQMLTGGQWTPNVAAIAPLVTKARIPYVVMSSGTSNTTRLSPFIVRVGFTVWQQSYHIGKWAAMNGITRASSIVSDYAAGLDAEEAFKRGFTDGGGTLVSSIRAPLRSPDYVPFLERIRREKPQALYGFNPGGPEATRFIKAYHDLGLAAGRHPAHRACRDRSRRRVGEHGRGGARRDFLVALFLVGRPSSQSRVRRGVAEGVRGRQRAELLRRRRLGRHGGDRRRDSPPERRPRSWAARWRR